MRGKRIFVGLCCFAMLFLLGSAGLAEEMGNGFSYQGMLSDGGRPVNGTRDMVFHLYSDDTCTTGVGSNISRPGVVIHDGVFSVELNTTPSNFNGQARWLRVQIDGVTMGCQEILATPYAFSLRPGARIEGERYNWHGLFVRNEATSQNSYGIWSETYSPIGRGVFGNASATSGKAYGVYGKSDSDEGAGVFARGTDNGIDLVLGGTASTNLGDDGVIASDPDYPSSDIYILSNDNVRINLDNDEDGEDADFEIYRHGILLFKVDDSGDITFGGNNIAAFPRPAYNSGWVSLSLPDTEVLPHNLGGNVDNYVVDLTCKKGTNVNNWGVGGDANDTEYYGVWWEDLTTTDITLRRWNNDTDCPYARIRIWIYL